MVVFLPEFVFPSKIMPIFSSVLFFSVVLCGAEGVDPAFDGDQNILGDSTSNSTVVFAQVVREVIGNGITELCESLNTPACQK